MADRKHPAATRPSNSFSGDDALFYRDGKAGFVTIFIVEDAGMLDERSRAVIIDAAQERMRREGFAPMSLSEMVPLIARLANGVAMRSEAEASGAGATALPANA